MSVIYRRTFNLTYSNGETITDDEQALFWNYLKDHQIFTTCNVKGETNYGTILKQDNKDEYQLWLDDETPVGKPLDYLMYVQSTMATFKEVYPNIKYTHKEVVGDVEEMILPNNRTLILSNKAVRSLRHAKASEDNIALTYGDEEIIVRALVWFHSYGGGFDLDFSIEYRTEKVVVKQMIEQTMTDLPNSVMGFVQARVEEALSFACNNHSVTDSPNIHCNFECVNSSKSECDISVVKKTRDARNRYGSEEE
jgi:hypothetical protein